LKHHGEVKKADLGKENLEALDKGLPNLLKHVENVTQKFRIPAVVAINKFPTDTEAELNLIKERCSELGVNVALSEVWGKGGAGGKELAEEVIRLAEKESSMEFPYTDEMSIKEKIEAITTKIYGAESVEYSKKADKEIENLEKLGFGNLPICMAKTQYSLTDDPKVIGRPAGFKIIIRDITISAGAGFIVALTGEIMKMPGLPRVPSAENIDVDIDGKIKGLF